MSSIDAMLGQLRQAATSTAAALAAARAAAPEETTASDDTGTVAVSVDRRGVPVGVRVADDWTRRTTADALGRAVLAAAGSAAAQLGQVMTAALRDAQAAGGAGADVPAVAVPEFEGTPRPLDELAELAVARLGRTDQGAVDAPPTASGSAGPQVTVTLGPGGLVGCDVDERWAAHQTGIALSTALTQALADAGRALAEQDARRREQDTLLAEAFAHLRALAPAQGEEQA